MLPPITYCEAGHNICSGCRTLLDLCETCRRPFLNLRNTSLENLARISMFPCSNKAAGCTAVVPMDFVIEHQRICPHSTLCPYVMIPSIQCNWTGPLKEAKSHILTRHRADICEVNGAFMDQVPDLNNQARYYKLISTLDELFFCVWQMYGIYYSYSVFYVGPNVIAPHFIHKLSVSSTDGIINDSWLRRMRIVKAWSEKLYTVDIPYTNLSRLHLANEQNRLPFTLEILRAPVL
jgi:hypothetical protein